MKLINIEIQRWDKETPSQVEDTGLRNALGDMLVIVKGFSDGGHEVYFIAEFQPSREHLAPAMFFRNRDNITEGKIMMVAVRKRYEIPA